MSVRRRGLCALGLALLLLAGCKSTDFDFSLGFLQGGTPGGDRVLAGSLETVTQSAEGTLKRLGMEAVKTNVGEAVYLSATTPSGARFKLILTREKGKEGEQTRARVEWEGRSDEQALYNFLLRLDADNRR